MEGVGNSPGGSGRPGDSWWPIYRGDGSSHDGIERLPPPPAWRRFDGAPPLESERFAPSSAEARRTAAARAYRASPQVLDLVNAALYLRRPLLVTGRPGTGKSTLAYSIAQELRLGPVLYWPITSRSTIADGLYRYDALGRLQEANLNQYAASRPGDAPPAAPDIGRYIMLGPLGTALLPRTRPRVLLVDELDKSDLDLPNDLLNVFEEGEFDIPELRRLPEEQSSVAVMTADGANRTPVQRGRITVRAFPVTVITSNGERDFPPAFLRRCLRLDLREPTRERLAAIVAAQLGDAAVAASGELIDLFLSRREEGTVATDQLLNAIFLATSGARGAEGGQLAEEILRPLDGSEP